MVTSNNAILDTSLETIDPDTTDTICEAKMGATTTEGIACIVVSLMYLLKCL